MAEDKAIEFMLLGESLTGSPSMKSYRAHFGTVPIVVAIIWQLLIENHQVSFLPMHFLWALHFLKCYPTTEVGASFCKVDPKTWRKWVWMVILGLFLALDMVSIFV
jgi:hypothetical protein